MNGEADTGPMKANDAVMAVGYVWFRQRDDEEEGAQSSGSGMEEGSVLPLLNRFLLQRNERSKTYSLHHFFDQPLPLTMEHGDGVGHNDGTPSKGKPFPAAKMIKIHHVEQSKVNPTVPLTQRPQRHSLSTSR